MYVVVVKNSYTVLAYARQLEDAQEVADVYRHHGVDVAVQEDLDLDPPYSIPSPPSKNRFPYRILVFPDGPWVASAGEPGLAKDLSAILGQCFWDGVIIRYARSGCVDWGHEVEHGPDCDGKQCKLERPAHGHCHVADPSLDGEPHCWTHCVCPDTPHGHSAHGNIVYVQRCKCGATRLVERNGNYWGASKWE